MTESSLAAGKKGLVSAGAGLVWRRQSILWWVFLVNAGLAALGTAPAFAVLKGALSHSLAGQPLVSGFDYGIFNELQRVPDVRVLATRSTSNLFAGLFAVFMLFVSGGILEAYRQDRWVTTGEFFAASGAYFWLFLRLALFSLVPFVFLGSLYQQLETFSDYVGDKVIADQVGFFIQLAGGIVLAALALFVRLWFDIAKVRAVAQNEHGMWHNMWQGLGIAWRERWTLLWMYFRITLVAWIALAVGFLIWTKLPPTAIPATFVLLELVILVQVATRLWQLASATAWYKQHPEMVPAPVEFPAPLFVDAVEARDQLGL